MDDLTREFLLESQEGLDRMERCLTDLETRPGDAELLADIFRSVHTIKGTTGFLGFSRLESLSHAGENLLGLLRDGKLAANADIISGLLSLMDMLRGVLHSIETTGGEGESEAQDSAMIERLERLQIGGVQVAVAEPFWRKPPSPRPFVQPGRTSRVLRVNATPLRYPSRNRLPRFPPERQGRPAKPTNRRGIRNRSLAPFPPSQFPRFLRSPRTSRHPKCRLLRRREPPTPHCASMSSFSTA